MVFVNVTNTIHTTHIIMANSLEKQFTEEWGNHWLSGITSLCNNKPLYLACPTFVQNKNMTLKMISALPKQTYKQKYLSANPNLTIDFIKKHPLLGWKWKEISKNAGITMQDITDNPDLPWCPKQFSYNPNLTIEFVLAHLDYKWDWEYIYEHVDIPIETVIKLDKILMELEHFLEWQITILHGIYCRNKCVTESVIENNPKFSWDYTELNKNTNISLDFAVKHGEKHWCWNVLHKHVNVNDIEKYEGFYRNKNISLTNYFDISALCGNPTLTMEFIIKHRVAEWHWLKISRNASTSFDELTTTFATCNNNAHLTVEYLRAYYVANPNVTIPFLRDYINSVYIYNECIHNEYLFSNPHIPFHFVLSQIPTFKNHANEIVAHPYDKDRQQFIETKMKNILLLFMHDFHQQPHIYIGYTHIEINEQIVANSYIMTWVLRY